jgi:hypothetical protein
MKTDHPKLTGMPCCGVPASIVFLSIAMLVVLLPAARAGDDLPRRFNFDRYTAMLDHSPFAVATAAALPAATPEIFKDLYVANVAHTPEVDLVTIVSSSDKNLKEYLTTAGPNEDGYAISNIEWSDQPGATKVTINKGGKFATLGFNEALISSPLPKNHPPVQMPRGVPRVTPAMRRFPQRRVPSLPRPTPHVRGVIPRNPAGSM